MLLIMWQSFFEENKSLWNEKVEVHLKSAFYDHASFLKGKSSLTEIEINALGEVRGKSLLHLQCHFGQDTLSWARLGAKATGVDFSEKAVEAARRFNDELGLDASFVLSELYSLPGVLTGQFDVVFTSFGVLAWLPDMEKWAEVVAHFLKPGGIFYIAEFHPMLYLFNFDNCKMEYGYFSEKLPYQEQVKGTYADPNAPIDHTEYFWNHATSEVITALLRQGLILLEFTEYDYSPFNCFPNMKEREPGRYVWGDTGLRLPHVFSLKMIKEQQT